MLQAIHGPFTGASSHTWYLYRCFKPYMVPLQVLQAIHGTFTGASSHTWYLYRCFKPYMVPLLYLWLPQDARQGHDDITCPRAQKDIQHTCIHSSKQRSRYTRARSIRHMRMIHVYTCMRDISMVSHISAMRVFASEEQPQP